LHICKSSHSSTSKWLIFVPFRKFTFHCCLDSTQQAHVKWDSNFGVFPVLSLRLVNL
jgi:hypothetical protein